MDKRALMFALVIAALVMGLGFKVSYDSGIQPGYFEKAEAPAYGVGGGEVKIEGISEELMQHYMGLAGEEEE